MEQRPRYWREMRRRKRKSRLPRRTRRPTCSKWLTMAVRPLRSRNCWPRSIHDLRSYQWAHAMFMGIRGGKFWIAWQKRRLLPTGRIWTGRSLSILTAKLLALSWRLFIEADFCSLNFLRRLPVFLNQSPRLGGIFLAHQNHGPTYAGQNVLLRVQGSQV